MRFDDPSWPRASAWLEPEPGPASCVVIGVPTSIGSISPSESWRTPEAFRDVLSGFSPFDGDAGVDLSEIVVRDGGDWPVDGLGLDEMVDDVKRRAMALAGGPVYTFVGGDNAITRPLVSGLASDDLGRFGVLTFDAHHDVRTLDAGPRNGTPIRGLIEDGLPGAHVAQIGIHSFANSAQYRRFCIDAGITVFAMGEVDHRGIDAVVDEALSHLAEAADHIYIDFDLDVLDRSFAPGCPGSRPGGMTPRQLMAAARRCGAHPAVVAADFVEVDVVADQGNLTMMNLASTFLAFVSGVATREDS